MLKGLQYCKNSFLVFSALLFLSCFHAQAQTTVTSTSPGNWNGVSWNPSLPTELDDVVIKNDSVVIPYGTTVEVASLEIGSGGKLVVNGNLVVNGDMTMTNTSLGFSMGSSAAVVVHGNFEVNNQVNISFSSFLAVYGDFINKGSSNQGSLDINDASLYVFGTVDGNGWPADFGCDTTYSGNTPDVTQTCDYGNENDYQDNQDNLPPEIVDLVNCYDLSAIENAETCPGGSAQFSVAQIANVYYQWQVKTPAVTDWSNTGTNSNVLTITNVSAAQDGNQYRVIVTPTDPNAACVISISRIVSLSLSTQLSWTGAKDSNWNDTANWGCGILPTININVLIPSGLTNYPVLSSGTAGETKDLTIESGASVKVTGNTLNIAGAVSANSSLDALAGKIVFAGTAAQIIPSGIFVSNRVQDLSIDNLAGVTSEGILEITGILKASNGNFNTGDQLTLISDNIQTALIDGAGNGEILGSVTMQRYLDTAFGYKYFSTPFSNSTVGDFSSFVDLSASFPNFYSYNENRKDGAGNDATGWENYTNPSGSLKAGSGYALNFGNSSAPATVEISGSVNNGPVSIALQNHNGIYTKGFQLVGNPYPSPIDWNAAGWTKNNIDDGIYFFTAGTTDQYTGTYTSYVNGVSSADGKSSNIIPSMQGFFIKVRDAVSGENYPINATLGMTNAVRVNDFSQPFLKKAETPKPLLRLTAGFGAKEQQDAMVIYFSPYSSLKFEQEKDAHKLMNTDAAVPNLYSISSDEKDLSINAVPMPSSGGYEKIPLGIKAERSGRMTIKLTDLKNLDSQFNVYLIDHQRNIGQNLSKKNNYSFEVQKGTWNSRFELMFSEEKMKDPAIAFDEPFSVEMQNSAVVVKLNLKNGQQGIVTVSTITGQVLQSRKGSGKDEVVFEGITSDGVYIINLDLGQEMFSKKVLKK